jgi:hypothetical protein
MPAIRLIRRALGASVSKRRGFRARGGALLGASAIGLTMLAPACADSPVVRAQIVADASGSGPTTVQTTQTFKTMKIILDINGDKIELGTTDLTPGAAVTVNGKSGLFGQLTPTQQQQLRQALQSLPPLDITTITTDAVNAAKAGDMKPGVSIVKTWVLLVNINGDKVELNSTSLTPDTPVTVNGKSGRFGDLTPTQQQQLRDALGKLKTLPADLPASINVIVKGELQKANLPENAVGQVMLELKTRVPDTASGDPKD